MHPLRSACSARAGPGGAFWFCSSCLASGLLLSVRKWPQEPPELGVQGRPEHIHLDRGGRPPEPPGQAARLTIPSCSAAPLGLGAGEGGGTDPAQLVLQLLQHGLWAAVKLLLEFRAKGPQSLKLLPFSINLCPLLNPGENNTHERGGGGEGGRGRKGGREKTLFSRAQHAKPGVSKGLCTPRGYGAGQALSPASQSPSPPLPSPSQQPGGHPSPCNSAAPLRSLT